jgi:uncharacterized protein (TIGR03382 family)
MKVKTLSVLAGLAGAAVLTGSANAVYTGLTVVSVNTTAELQPDSNPGVITNITRHRVYATFSSPNDRLLVWGGGGANFVVPMVVQNTDALGIGLGSGFLNHENGGNLPSNTLAISNSDTFYTLAVTRPAQIPFPTDGGLQSQGLPDPTGTTITVTNGAMTTAPTVTTAGVINPITVASFQGDLDTPNRILLLQLVVAQGQNVRGTMGVIINNNAPLAGGDTILTGQTFSSVIPAPGAMALLGLAGLVGSRRRRA